MYILIHLEQLYIKYPIVILVLSQSAINSHMHNIMSYIPYCKASEVVTIMCH